MGSGLAFCSCCLSLFKHTILGLDTFMISDETPDEKEKILWETLAFLGVLKSPMKLVTGGIKVRESFGWIFGLAFLRCSFPGSERPQVNGSEVKGPNYNMITYDFLCLTKLHTSFLQILLNKCSFSLFKDILFCVYMHTRARMCECMQCVGAPFLRTGLTSGCELHMDAGSPTQVSSRKAAFALSHRAVL